MFVAVEEECPATARFVVLSPSQAYLTRRGVRMQARAIKVAAGRLVLRRVALVRQDIRIRASRGDACEASAV